jgi:hypothetical protein
MSGFLYFLPGAKAAELSEGSEINSDFLKKWKLDQVLSDCTRTPDHVVTREAKGPDGSDGIILTVHDANATQGAWGYQPSRQQWRKAEDESGRWIGWLESSPISPEAIKKRSALVAKWVISDARGNEWDVVTARSSDSGAGMLPCDYAWKDGKMVSIVNPIYRTLFDLSGEVYDHYATIVADEDAAFRDGLRSEEFLALAAVSVIGVNYRVGIAETTVLQELGYSLISTENIGVILSCFIDRPLLEEFVGWNKSRREKKTSNRALSSESCSSGPEGSIENTSQPDVELLSQK